MKHVFSILIVALSLGLQAGNPPAGFHIQVKLPGYTQDTLLLGYQLGDKNYVRDTATRTPQGLFIFSADTLLPCGVYLIITKPENQYFQIILSPTDQQLEIETDYKDPYNKAVIRKSEENKLFFDYMQFLGNQRKIADQYTPQLDSTKTQAQRDAAKKKLDDLTREVLDYQKALIARSAQTVTAALIKSSLDVEIPEFTDWKDSAELQVKRYQYYRAHFFDNTDLANDCLLRTPLMQAKVTTYFDKVLAQHPDTIIIEVDRVLKMMSPDNFQFFVTTLLNSYAKNKYVGFDAVYSHIGMKYYRDRSITPWVEDSVRAKIVQNAMSMEPTLIGRVAPNIRMQKRDSTFMNLHDVKAEWTVLLIWAPTCGHCKKSMPDYNEFYEKYKAKGVEILAVCSVSPTEVAQCWEFVDKNGRMNWVNVTDPFNMSRYRTLYDVKTTPKVYVLDRNKVIRSKQMESDQVDEVLDALLEEEARKMRDKQ